MTGVYFLFYKKKLVYIGKTEMWPIRITQHASLKFDDARILECPKGKITEYEARLISIFKPKNNIACTPRAMHSRLTASWIIANADVIKESILNQDFECVKLARKKFKYSPKSGAGDIKRTIVNAYEKIFGVWYDWDLNQFTQPQVL